MEKLIARLNGVAVALDKAGFCEAADLAAVAAETLAAGVIEESVGFEILGQSLLKLSDATDDPV